MALNYLMGLVFNNSINIHHFDNMECQDSCEIVSIAWCLIDLVNQKILCIDQSSICPLDFHNLEDKCDHISSAPPLEDFLLELESRNSTFIGSLEHACIITDGPIPLRQTLHPEALRKNIPLHTLFFSYFDLQKEFCKAHNKSHVPGIYNLPKILRDLALFNREYVVQNNIEDIKLFSKVIISLIQMGHKFKDPQLISAVYKEYPFPQVGFMSNVDF